jgi:hypothetical protein
MGILKQLGRGSIGTADVVADLDGYSKGEPHGFLDPLPPLPLLTKEGSENRRKLPTRFREEPKN